MTQGEGGGGEASILRAASFFQEKDNNLSTSKAIGRDRLFVGSMANLAWKGRVKTKKGTTVLFPPGSLAFSTQFAGSLSRRPAAPSASPVAPAAGRTARRLEEKEEKGAAAQLPPKVAPGLIAGAPPKVV